MPAPWGGDLHAVAVYAANDSAWFEAGGGYLFTMSRYKDFPWPPARDIAYKVPLRRSCAASRNSSVVEHLIGPFSTMGGNDWSVFDWPFDVAHACNLANHSKLAGAWLDDNDLAITAALFTPIDASGHLIAFPPLHKVCAGAHFQPV